eukprot:TRINITY_DN737_c1_g1_i1.p1 TRINITY_DN737_c1_g1~~TRINITY_DN737_c1_g1_i1.p1  ORF type:complete len:567 (-),score=272.30 TRINITY_DN737_c1_g1_i1:5-1705(-)
MAVNLQYKISSSNITNPTTTSTSSTTWQTISVNLTETTGLELKEEFGKISRIPSSCLRLLVAGKFLKDEVLLSVQGVKSNSKILVMPAPNKEIIEQGEEREKKNQKIEQIKKAAELLAKRKDGGSSRLENYYFELTNQNGQPIQLAPSDRDAIVLGLTLSSKGKALADEGDFHGALEIYLQADSEGFSKCSEHILEMIDNYGVLCLDIVWLYFKLENPSFMQDAKFRLHKARQSFQRAYGANFSRLSQLRDGGCAEMALIARLDLMEAIFSYHQQDYRKARSSLNIAKQRIQELIISEIELEPILLLGFTDSEGRIALRTCNKNIDAAVSFLLERKEQRAKQKLDEEERQYKRKRQIGYGKTSSGSLVEVDFVDQLLKLDFEERLIAEALRQTNNNIDDATHILLTQPEILEIALLKQQTKKKIKLTPSEQDIQSIIDMGFSRNLAIGTLEISSSKERAIELLLNGKGIEKVVENNDQNTITNDNDNDNNNPNDNQLEKENNDLNLTNSNNDNITNSSNLSNSQNYSKVEEEIISDVSTNPDQHLDYTLNEELIILQKYEAFLNSL